MTLPLTNLRLWLDADTLSGADGSAVSTWADGSGAGNDAAQATGANQPVMHRSACNGQSAVTFNGSSSFMTNASLTIGGAISIYVVASKTTATGYKRLFSNENNVFVGQDSGSSRKWTAFYGTGASWGTTASFGADATSVSGQFNVFTAINDGTIASAWLNGMTLDSRTNPYAAFADGYALGAQATPSPAQFWPGDIAAVLVYDGAHTAAQRKQVWDDLHNRYALPYWPTLTRPFSTPIIATVAATWESSDVANPDIFWDTPHNRWVMNYSGYDGAQWHTGLAYSTDLLTWTKEPVNPVLSPVSGEGYIAANGSIVRNGSTYYLYYNGQPASGPHVYLATSSDLVTWTRANGGNPILTGTVGGFDANGQADPCARVLDDGNVELLYVGIPSTGARQIGRAVSADGLTFGAGILYLAPPPQSQLNFGEPAQLFPPIGSSAAAMRTVTTDGADVANTRFINAAFTPDGGATWQWRVNFLGPGAATWESVQVFDSNPVLSGSTLYLFYAGAPAPGAAEGMGAQIGVATSPWEWSISNGMPFVLLIGA